MDEITFLMRGKSAAGAAKSITSITGFLITNSLDDDHPVTSGGNTTWTYRSYAALTNRGVTDWDISKEVGKWKISVNGDAHTNRYPIYLKIQKRQQIVGYARHWAEIWPSLNYPPNITSYPYPPQGQPAFGRCDGFVTYVYGHVGLPAPLGIGGPSGLVGVPAKPMVIDNGKGAIRYYQNRAIANATLTAAHVAIIDPNAVDPGSGMQIDNNWDNRTNEHPGPTVRPLDDGTSNYNFLAPYWANAENRTLPDPTPQSDKSLLQALDDESGCFAPEDELWGPEH